MKPKKNAKKTTKTPALAFPKTFRAPKIIDKAPPRKATLEDLTEVNDQSLVIAIDLKRQSNDSISKIDLEDGQRLFPYTVLPRLFVGWQAVGFISSFEMRLTSEHPLPQVTIRFAEKMSLDDLKELTPEVRSQIESQIALVRQYPFVKVESPLLPAA